MERILRQEHLERYGDLIQVETGEDFYRATLALPLLSD